MINFNKLNGELLQLLSLLTPRTRYKVEIRK